MKLVKMCASMQSSSWWYTGRRPRSPFNSWKAYSISPCIMCFLQRVFGSHSSRFVRRHLCLLVARVPRKNLVGEREANPSAITTWPDKLLDGRVGEPVRVHRKLAPQIGEAVHDDDLLESPASPSPYGSVEAAPARSRQGRVCPTAPYRARPRPSFARSAPSGDPCG